MAGSQLEMVPRSPTVAHTRSASAWMVMLSLTLVMGF